MSPPALRERKKQLRRQPLHRPLGYQKLTKFTHRSRHRPKIKDMTMSLAILEISPINLSGGNELLSSLAMAAFDKNKSKIIAEANKHLGKRPF
jgi:hypothetical protein